MSRPGTFVVAAASLIAVVVGTAWFIAHEANEAIREYAELGETVDAEVDEMLERYLSGS